jgi:hypothetical protein
VARLLPLVALLIELLVSSPTAGGLSVMASKRRGERVRGGVAGAVGDLREGQLAEAQVVPGEGHAPLGEVLHRRLAESVLKGSRKGRSRKAAEGGELGDRPPVGRVGVYGAKSHAQAGVGGGSIPARCTGALAKRGADGVNQDDVEQPVQHGLLPWLRGCQFA